VAGRWDDAVFRDRSKMDILSVFYFSAFSRKQSFVAAILAGEKMSEIPEHGITPTGIEARHVSS
jgi:hypothetical protein